MFPVAALLDGIGYNFRVRFNPAGGGAVEPCEAAPLGRLHQRRRRVRPDNDAAAAEHERGNRGDAAAARVEGGLAHGGLAGAGRESGVHAGGVEAGAVASSRSTAGSPMLRGSQKLARKSAGWNASKRPGSSTWAQALAASARCVFASSDAGERGAKSIPSAAAWRCRFAIIAASSSGSYPRLESGSPAGGTSGWISKGRQTTSSAMRPASCARAFSRRTAPIRHHGQV